MSLSNYAENKLLDHVTGKASFTAPTTVYAQLHTGAPGEDCTSNVAANNTRKSIAWNAASGGSISASATLSWTSVSTTETYSHFSLWDASTSGNPLWYGALSSSAAVTAGDTFEITSLTLSLD